MSKPKVVQHENIQIEFEEYLKPEQKREAIPLINAVKHCRNIDEAKNKSIEFINEHPSKLLLVGRGASHIYISKAGCRDIHGRLILIVEKDYRIA